MERVRLYAQLSRWCDVTVRVRRTRVASAYSVADALVLSPSGELLAELTGVRMRPLDRPGASSTPPTESPLVTQIRWTPTPRPDGSAAAGTWVVLHRGPDDPLGLRIAGQLRAQGAQVVEVCADVPAQPVMDSQQRRVMRYADEVAFERLWKEIDEPVAGVVHLWNTGSARPDVAELRLGVYGCLAAVKTLARRQRTAQFLVVTENSQPVAPGDTPVPARAALWGFVRTAAIEYPGLRPRLIDIDADSGAAVTAELGEGVPEVAYRKGERYEPTRGAARLT